MHKSHSYIKCIISLTKAYAFNMNKLKHYTIKGIIFVSITGTASHFVYEWSGNNSLVGLIFPINESVWEHMKLGFFPMLLYSFYMNRRLKSDYPCVTSAMLFGVLLSTYLIPVLFYTYSGGLGYNTTVLDISTFFVSVILSFIAVYKFSVSCILTSYTPLFRLLIILTTISFLLFTYHPLNIGIFVDPAK